MMTLKAEAVTTPTQNTSSQAQAKTASRDQTLRERPAASEEEERTKKSRNADPAGQKRKDPEAATTPSHSRAKAKSADPVGQKRKSASASEEAATAPSPSKSKATEPTGEKRKADSDAEDMEDTVGQGSPIKARVDDDEDIRRVQATTFHATTLDLLELHSGSGVAKEADKFGMNTVDLGLWDLDNISHRDRVVELVREKKPAFIIGRPQSKMFDRVQNTNEWTGKRRQQYKEAVGHIRFVCELYQLQVREGRWFVHERLRGSTSWEMEEVSSLKKVE